MTFIDLIAIAVVVGYGILGWFSGTVRRVIGLAGLYLALVAATYMGQWAGGIYQQVNPAAPVPDARLAGWLFFLVLLVVAIEGLATAVHTQLQVAVVALNRSVGVILGLVTGVVVTVAAFYILAGYAQGVTAQASNAQIEVRDNLNHSRVMLPLARKAGPPVLPLLSGALPRDSEAYFIFEGPR